MYKLKQPWCQRAVFSVMLPSGKRVNLVDKSLTTTVKANKNFAAYEKIIPAISQDEIKELVKSGHKYGTFFEKIEVPVRPQTSFTDVKKVDTK